MKKTISVICPVFNEELCVEKFYALFCDAVAPLAAGYDIELIFTNNASTDRTLAIIRELREKDPRIQVITLSRNFGYQSSVLCGITHGSGDAFIVIDVDGEDPPSIIPQFVAGWEQGNDLVYGIRQQRPEPQIVIWARKLFYRFTRVIADADFILDMAEFSLFTRRMRDQVVLNQTGYPFIRAELAYLGFKRHGIPYARQRRIAGESHYSFMRMTQFAVGGILSSSTFPLRILFYICFPLAILDMLAGLVALAFPINLQALAMWNLSFLVFAGGTIGIYAARIYKDGLRRPPFVVDWANTTLKTPDADRAGVST